MSIKAGEDGATAVKHKETINPAFDSDGEKRPENDKDKDKDKYKEDIEKVLVNLSHKYTIN